MIEFIKSTCFQHPLVKISYLFSELGWADHARLCRTARLEIYRRDDLAHVVPSSRNGDVEPPEVHDFGYTKRVALQCHMNPPVYIYFKEPRVSKVVKVVLVIEDSNPEPKAATTTPLE